MYKYRLDPHLKPTSRSGKHYSSSPTLSHFTEKVRYYHFFFAPLLGSISMASLKLTLKKLSSPQVVVSTAPDATSDDNFIKITTFPLLWLSKSDISTMCWQWSNVPSVVTRGYLSIMQQGLSNEGQSPTYDKSSTFDTQWAVEKEKNTMVNYPDNKVHGANMGPTWALSAPGGPHIGPMNLAIRVAILA